MRFPLVATPSLGIQFNFEQNHTLFLQQACCDTGSMHHLALAIIMLFSWDEHVMGSLIWKQIMKSHFKTGLMEQKLDSYYV